MVPGDDNGRAGADDLDALIGEARLEAARRRAAPDFPVDEEARLSVEMDGQGPAGIAGADLTAVTAALRAVERTAADAAPGKKADPAAASRAERRVADVAGLTASAITALATRLAALERRAPRAAGPAATAGTPAPGPVPDHDRLGEELLRTWIDDVLAGAGEAGGGRILVAGAGARGWVDRLRSEGFDPYGVSPEGQPFGDRGAIRSGGILAHLQTVGDQGLTLALLAGPVPAAEAERVADLAAEMVRTARRIIVCSDSPWAWRRRIGDAAADTSPRRPVGPEAWLQAFNGAGAQATARYDAVGHTYLLLADPVTKAAE